MGSIFNIFVSFSWHDFNSIVRFVDVTLIVESSTNEIFNSDRCFSAALKATHILDSFLQMTDDFSKDLKAYGTLGMMKLCVQPLS